MRLPVVLLASLLALAACGFPAGEPPPTREVNVGGKRIRLSLGSAEPVAGTPYVLLPLFERSDDGGYSSYGGRQRERNRIVLDTGTGVSRRLLPDDAREIVRFDVGQAAPNGAANVVRHVGPGEATSPRLEPGRYVAVIAQASGENRRHDLITGQLGGEQRMLARGLANVHQLWSLQPSLLAVMVEAEGRLLYRVYDLNSAALVREAALSL